MGPIDVIREIDTTITGFVNGYARLSAPFDQFMVFASDNTFLKTAVFVLPLWWFWFNNSERREHDRHQVVGIFVSAIIAIAVSRGLQLFLPYRPRPLHDAGLGFIAPTGLHETALRDWSSFPSDNAVYFFALATGLFFLSRRIGIFAFFWAAVFVCWPRLYLGLHYATDLAGGAAIGIGIALLAHKSNAMHPISSGVLQLERRWPQIFYPAAFLLTWQMMFMFSSVRNLISYFGNFG